MDKSRLPVGTVTFVFTDIEGSTRLVQELGSAWADVLETHNELLRTAIAAHDGLVVKTEGDSFFAVFTSAPQALAAAARAQEALSEHQWNLETPVRVRIGIHTGTGILGGEDYIGLDVHRAARISAAAHGGQTIMSEATAVLVERELPTGLDLRDLGKHRLKDLTQPEALFQLLVPGLDTDFPPLKTLDAIPNNLPVQLTSFVGRRHELGSALALLARSRLLTLTGPGGTGKTRLALQIGAEMSGDFRHGVYFVDLAPITEVDVVPSKILVSLDLPANVANKTPTETLLESLSDKEVLVILDNFEQIIGAAPLVGDLLRASPHSRFLVTSRTPLRISGEQEMPVPPLYLPSGIGEDLGETEAVQLFVDRARAVRPDFELTAENSTDVADLVRRLDGLPLAIELVASRIRLLPVSAIVARFDPLTLGSGSVDLPERQRTIEGAIRWSYDLLSDEAKRLFAHFSVFAGGARLEEIERVCRPPSGFSILEGLEDLLDQSLLRTEVGEDQPRFRMLHVIREYGAQRLAESGEADEVQRRHLDAYTDLTEIAAQSLKGGERRHWLNLVGRDHDNVRSALDWAERAGEADLACRLGAAAWRFWQARGHLHEAERRLRQVLAIAGSRPRGRARALEALGGILWWQGRSTECREVYRQALELERVIGDPAAIANALYNHALATGFDLHDDLDPVLPEMEAELDEAEALYRDLDDLGGLGDVFWARGNLAGLFLGDFDSGMALWEKSIDYYRQAGNAFGLGWGLFDLANTARIRGDFETARHHLMSGLQLFADHDDISAAVMFLAVAAGLAYDTGDPERAARLGGAFHALRIASGTDLISHAANRVENVDFETLESLDGPLREAYLEGRAMDLTAAVTYALDTPDGV